MRLPHACLICGLVFRTKNGLCEHCGPKLFGLREPCRRDESGLEARSLFSWRKQSKPALHMLAHKLKGKEDPEPWRELAAWFLQIHPTGQARPLVPVPGGRHALGWARALSELTGLPVRDVLVKTSSSANKDLSRVERARLRFESRDINKCTKYIIVDDIITTGATARAAYWALGRPRNCEVWCLMDRRPWQAEGPLL